MAMVLRSAEEAVKRVMMSPDLLQEVKADPVPMLAGLLVSCNNGSLNNT